MKKMIAFTVIVLVSIVLAHMFVSDLEDAGSLGLDGIMMISMAAVMLLVLTWSLWILIFSKWKWSRRIPASIGVFSLPFLFMLIFRPVMGGDANFVRFEPVWASRTEAEPVKIDSVPTGIDLASETPGDYPRFLGTQQNAVSTAPLQIYSQKFGQSKQLWKQQIGAGWSGFVARNGYAVTMEQRRDLECVTCYDVETGKLVWVHEHAVRHCDAMNLGRVGPRSTPVIHQGRVYAVGAVGHFVCLDGADGTVIWEHELAEMVNSPVARLEPKLGGPEYFWESKSSLNWGRSGSPLIVDDMVVVTGGGTREGSKTTLIAFSLESGDVRWQGGDEMISYSSPILATIAGQRQILYVAESKVMGFDPLTGNVLWSRTRAGDSSSAANCSQPTVVDGNHVLTSKGYPDGGGELLNIEFSDGKYTVTSDWSDHRVLKTKLTSPVIHKGHSFAISNGFLECASLKDGRRVWKRRGRFGHGQLMLIGDQLLVHTELGVARLVDADPAGYKEHASFQTIDGVCWNTLCLYGSRLLVRSELETACYELPIVETADSDKAVEDPQ